VVFTTGGKTIYFDTFRRLGPPGNPFRLYVASLDLTEGATTQPVPGLDGAFHAAISPDGKSIAYFRNESEPTEPCT
jgi:Tol biopolymer transport system component